MQQSVNTKQFVANHLASVALAFGIFVSSLTVVATLGVTGELPTFGGDNAVIVVPQASAADAERRQLEMERNDFRTWQHQLAVANADVVAQRQLDMERADFRYGQQQLAAANADIAEQRQLDMERDDFLAWQRQFAVAPIDSDALVPATAYDMEQRALRMERDEFLDWQKSLAEMR